MTGSEAAAKMNVNGDGISTTSVPEFGSKEFIDVLVECVKSPGFFQDDNERGSCRQLVDQLRTTNTNDGEELFQIAAQTSYAYWYLSTVAASSSSNNEPLVNDEDMLLSAMKEARRHYASVNGDMDKALDSLTDSCRYRNVGFIGAQSV
jgi:GrpB-like predicted nucleotidyltransferase (UPF0157 family)